MRPSDPTRPTEGLENPARERLAVRQLTLQVIAGSDRDLSYQTGNQRITIGTHRSADFVLRDKTVSHFHCEIAVVDGLPVLRDLDSRNGTMVDNVFIHVAPLPSGTTITLGHTKVRFLVGSEEVPIDLSPRERFGLLSGRTPAMRAVFHLLEHAAASKATVLLQGETGIGKDLAAESLHLESDRRDGPFVVVDCGAIPPHLLESELFGHEKGAFTGADRSRAGAFERASGGTLFLDEVGELSGELQPKLLRSLESRKIQRVGGSASIPVDVRVIAATNRNLRRELNAGRFRPDLFYRLAIVEITLPPLRERLADLPLLVEELLKNMGAEHHPAAEALRAPGFLAELGRHTWPGNVRELRNNLERSLALGQPAIMATEGAPHDELDAPFRAALGQFQRRYFEKLLRRHKNNVAAAARAAGISRVSLYEHMARAGLR